MAEILMMSGYSFEMANDNQIKVTKDSFRVNYDVDLKSWREMTIWARGFVAGKAKGGWGAML